MASRSTAINLNEGIAMCFLLATRHLTYLYKRCSTFCSNYNAFGESPCKPHNGQNMYSDFVAYIYRCTLMAKALTCLPMTNYFKFRHLQISVNLFKLLLTSLMIQCQSVIALSFTLFDTCICMVHIFMKNVFCVINKARFNCRLFLHIKLTKYEFLVFINTENSYKTHIYDLHGSIVL